MIEFRTPAPIDPSVKAHAFIAAVKSSMAYITLHSGTNLTPFHHMSNDPNYHMSIVLAYVSGELEKDLQNSMTQSVTNIEGQ